MFSIQITTIVFKRLWKYGAATAYLISRLTVSRFSTFSGTDLEQACCKRSLICDLDQHDGQATSIFSTDQQWQPL